MRVLLCDSSTGMFYQDSGKWTEDLQLAQDFRSGPRAIMCAREESLRGVEVFWDFDDPEYNVRLPVTHEDAEPLRQAA